MRIIAGNLKGRIFHDPPGHHAHPMSDKARGALFNALGDIESLSFLDAFAGSGALSFEAISRGAKDAVAIESRRPIFKAVTDSAKLLGVSDQVKVIYADCGSWSNRSPDKQFDVVMLDPPYDFLQMNILPKLTKHAKKSGVIVVSWPSRERIPEFSDCQMIMDKKYGDAHLVFYRKLS